MNSIFAMVTSRLRGNKTSFSARTLAPLLATAVCVYAPVVALLTLAYTEVSPWTAPLFIAPALAAQRLFAMYLQQRTLASDLKGANERLNRSNLEFAEALVATLEQSDLYTAGHSKAVAIYSRDIAERMGLPLETQERAYLCGLVHDIGKVGLPASLLLKNGPLTLEERREMQRHSEIGESILERVETYADVALIVRHHHERIDGEGYPDGIAGEMIPPLSKIIAVADAYNAMTSDRPYRDAMPSRVARLRLAQAVESQFDTSVVAAFEALLAGAIEEYRTAKRADFHPISAGQLRGAPSFLGLHGRRGLTHSLVNSVHRESCSRPDTELVEHVVNVNLDGRFTDEELCRRSRGSRAQRRPGRRPHALGPTAPIADPDCPRPRGPWRQQCPGRRPD